MYQFSDVDTTDSEEGVRFKTESTRNKQSSNKSSPHSERKSEESRRRSRSHSRDFRRYDRHRSPKRKSNKKKRKKSKRKSSSSDSLSLSDESVKRKEYPLKRKYDRSRKEESSHSRRRSPYEKVSKENSRDKIPHSHKSSSHKVSKNKTNADNLDCSEVTSEDVSCDSGKPEQSFIGPCLPTKSKQIISKTDEINKQIEVDIIGPLLPPHFLSTTGKEKLKETSPKLPDNDGVIEKEKLEETSPKLPDNDGFIEKPIEPSLPAMFEEELESKADKRKYIGPSLPVHIREKLHESANVDVGVDEEKPEFLMEPSPTPIEETVEVNDDCYGPLPADFSITSEAHIALEKRALHMKLNQLNPVESKTTVREEWMLELPEVKAANLGLGPRQFKNRAGPDLSDRSSWTDTPQQKETRKVTGKSEQKVDLKKEAEKNEINRRNKEQEKIIKKLKKKKEGKSLLELHQDKLQEKKKKEVRDMGNIRRPFSREIDLKVNRFDEAQKKAIFKKAELLDDRFSRGQSKFL